MIVTKVVWRYAFSKSNRHRSANIVILVGISVGMTAILVILGLMNSLQFGLLDQLRSLQSFHIRIELPAEYIANQKLEETTMTLEGISGVQYVVPVIDTVALVRNMATGRASTARIRAIPSSLLLEDNPFSQHTMILAGEKHIGSGISVGYAFAANLSIRLGMDLELTILRKGRTAVLAPYTFNVQNTGYFRTGLPEFDLGTLLADIDYMIPFIGSDSLYIGLYLDSSNMNNIDAVVHEVDRILPGVVCTTWQESNRAFYSALMLEKILMYLFLFFMFLILGVNMRNASARLLHAKLRETAAMRAMGMRLHLAHSVFILQSVLVTILGEVTGIVGALFVSKYIGTIFSLLDKFQQLFTGTASPLLTYPFSLAINPLETVLLVIAVLLLSAFFSWTGCRKYFAQEPMEILSHA